MLLAVVVACLLATSSGGAHAQSGPIAPRDGWWDLANPCDAVLRHLRAMGRDPSIDFSPVTYAMARRGWAAMFPVVVAVAEDPSLGEDSVRLQQATASQVYDSMRGARLFYTGTAPREAWGRVLAAFERGLTALDAGQPVEPGLLRLAALLNNPDVGYGYAAVGELREPECPVLR
jgi:hypothetical protein